MVNGIPCFNFKNSIEKNKMFAIESLTFIRYLTNFFAGCLLIYSIQQQQKLCVMLFTHHTYLVDLKWPR